jgi:ribonuclease P protein component
LVRQHLSTLSSGTDLVIRALPPAATASSAELAHDLQSGIAVAARKWASATHRAARVEASGGDRR